MNQRAADHAMKATATLNIPGMGSDYWARFVKTSPSRLKGVGDIRTSLASHRAEVAFDPSGVDAAALRNEVVRAGYEVDAVAEDATSGETEVRLVVPGMGNDHCAGIVSESIRRLPGIADVSTSIARHRVRVRLDGTQTDAEAIRAAVERAGYLILGACSPSMAYKALRIEPRAAAVLPCNVILRAVDGGVVISAIDPVASMQAIDYKDLHKIAAEVRQLLVEAVEAA